VIGLFKTEIIRRPGPWRSLEPVALVTRAWVERFKHRLLLEPIGSIPPATAAQRACAERGTRAVAAQDSKEPASRKPGAVPPLSRFGFVAVRPDRAQE
jgi:hypothetical protein